MSPLRWNKGTGISAESARHESDPALAALCRFKRVVSFFDKRACGRGASASCGNRSIQPRSVVFAGGLRFIKKLSARAAETLNHARNEFTPDVENLFIDSFIELHWGSRDDGAKFAFTAPK